MRPAILLSLILALSGGSCSGGIGLRPAKGVPEDGWVRSNILRADYAGSAACAGCHPDVYQAFLGSPMHKMTRIPETAEVRAPFSAERYRFKDDVATLSQAGGHRYLRVFSPRFGDHLYQVTRIIGGRYREDFAGVEVPAPGASVPEGSDELILPLSYVFASQSFRPKGYSVMVTERPGLRAGGVWNRTCVFCHNTSPYFASLYGALLGPGAPGYQGEVVDALLPEDRRYTFVVSRPDLLAEALRGEIRTFGGQPREEKEPSVLLNQALRTTRENLRARHLLEIGIGCESCHGGSKEHVKNYRQRPTFEIRSPFLSARPALANPRPPSPAEWANRACARCHQVLFSRYPFTWEGGRRRGDPGGSHINSGEGRDFLLGGCSGAMTCTACHDPHGEDRPERLASLTGKAGNALCTGCHPGYRGDEALRAHAHHDPAGAGGACINCHMPRKNMGLGYNLGRYHRIGSPTDPARVQGDRPLECALCHGDKSVEYLVTAMERLWGKHYDRAALRGLYGDLRDNALRATLSRGKGHEQATAMILLGERKDLEALPSLLISLTNPYPLLRYFARKALSDLTGRPCDVDLEQEDEKIRTQAERWQKAHPKDESAISLP